MITFLYLRSTCMYTGTLHNIQSSTCQLVSFPDPPPGLKGGLGTRPHVNYLLSEWLWVEWVQNSRSVYFSVNDFFSSFLVGNVSCSSEQKVTQPVHVTQYHDFITSATWYIAVSSCLKCLYIGTVVIREPPVKVILVAHKQTDSPVQVLGYLLIYLPWLIQWNNPGETTSFQQPHKLYCFYFTASSCNKVKEFELKLLCDVATSSIQYLVARPPTQLCSMIYGMLKGPGNRLGLQTVGEPVKFM